MAGLLPIDEACELIAASFWTDYATAQTAARDVIELLARYEDLAFRPLRPLNADQERRYLRFKASKAALDNWLCGCLESGEYKLWARPGSLTAKLQLIPAPAAANGLEFDYEKRTAVGDGLPPLYDLQMRPPAVPVKRWRKPPPQKDIKGALEDIRKAKPTLLSTALANALWKHFGEGMTRQKARNAIKTYAPQTVKPRGRPRKNNSPK